MKKKMQWAAACLLLCLLLLMPAYQAEAATKVYTKESMIPYSAGTAYVWAELPYGTSSSKIKKVTWSTNNSKAVTISTYSNVNTWAYVTFKKPAKLNVTGKVVLKNGKVYTTVWKLHIFSKSFWYTRDGYTYYMQKDGSYARDTWIGSRYVNEYGYWDKHFVQTEKGIKYKKNNGTYAKAEWIVSDDWGEYYFDKNGYMLKSRWVGKYFVQKNGRKKDGMIRVGNSWKISYSGDSSNCLKNTWDYLNGYRVYLDGKGNPVKDKWKKIDGKFYCFNKKGYLLTSRWIGEYYVDELGCRVTSKRVGDYYVGKNGKKVKNKWVAGYYVNSAGKIQKNRWIGGTYVGINGKKIAGMNYRNGTVAINGSCLLGNKSQLNQLVSYAKKELGKPYIWGGNGPNGYDCSGFINYCYRSIGITLPRTTYYLYNSGVNIDPNDMSEWQVGDLLVNQGTIDGRGNGHVVMYIGNGKTIECTSGGVQIRNASTGYYARVRRILYVG